MGGLHDNSSTGAAWVYTCSGGVWTQQGSKLVGAGAVGQAGQGFSVALSANGNAVIVGLRRIIAIETDLFRIQAEILRERRNELAPVFDELPDQTPDHMRDESDRLSCSDSSLSARELTYCFLRLGNLDGGAFERLGRYNAALWKQTAQTLFLLGPVRRQS